MFTGIITHRGRFHSLAQGRREMRISAPPELAAAIETGGSLAVNGVCLSLTRKLREDLFFCLSQETLRKTTLGVLKQGDSLNLELPVTLATPLGGHLVTGHIDGIGRVNRITPRSGGKRITVTYPPDLSRFFVPKGSVALDGVSLTVADLKPPALEVEVIPITLSQSTLGSWRPGQSVNIECDIVGKYVYNWTVKA